MTRAHMHNASRAESPQRNLKRYSVEAGETLSQMYRNVRQTLACDASDGLCTFGDGDRQRLRLE